MLRKSIAEQTQIVVPTLDVFLKHYTDSKYVKTEFENLVKNGTLIPFFAFYHKLFIGKAYLVVKLKDLQVADGQRVAYLCNFEVKRLWQNKGVGTKMLHTVMAYAKRNGFEKLTLAVNEANERNMHLYGRAGFRTKNQNHRYGLAVLYPQWRPDQNTNAGCLLLRTISHRVHNKAHEQNKEAQPIGSRFFV